jgi:hypothetical protein
LTLLIFVLINFLWVPEEFKFYGLLPEGSVVAAQVIPIRRPRIGFGKGIMSHYLKGNTFISASGGSKGC